jgi:hypothetical protein
VHEIIVATATIIFLLGIMLRLAWVALGKQGG